MFSLDVVRWRDKQQGTNGATRVPTNAKTTRLPTRELPATSTTRRSKPLLPDDQRHEQDAAANRPSTDMMGEQGEQHATLPSVHQSAQIERDKKLKRLYGRTQKEMHTAYVDRVGQWMQTAPTQQWANGYAKQTSYSTQYVPRERIKTKELGSPMLTTNLYSPRAVFKGGGECVRPLAEDQQQEEQEREKYSQAIRFIEKSRYKGKEIQPPMSIPKNKSLECAHYFVQDVINSSSLDQKASSYSAGHHEAQQAQQQQRYARPAASRSQQPQQLRPLTVKDGLAIDYHGDHHFDPPPTTAESVALPQWRVHDPKKWTCPSAFVSTVATTTAHTAQNRSITGTHYSHSVLTSDSFVDPHKRHALPSKDAALQPRDHERRAHTAMANVQRAKSPQRQDRKYFSSMWTQLGSLSAVSPCRPPLGTPVIEPLRDGQAAADAVAASAPPSSPVNGGRSLALQLRETASRAAASSPKQKQRTSRTSRTSGMASVVLVRPLAAQPSDTTLQ